MMTARRPMKGLKATVVEVSQFFCVVETVEERRYAIQKTHTEGSPKLGDEVRIILKTQNYRRQWWAVKN